MRWMALLLAFAALIPVPAFALPGMLRVTVVHESDELGWAGVPLVLTGPSPRATATTDAAGVATFDDLAPGSYRLEATPRGAGAVTIEGVQVMANRVTTQQIRVPDRSVAEEVTASSVGGFLDHIPAGRSYQEAVAAVPGVHHARAEDPPPAPPPASGPAPAPLARLDRNALLAPDPVEPTDRRVYHHGWASLQAADPTAVVDRVAATAVAAGGYVEHLDAATAVVRVPADRFDDCFAQVLALGVVMDQRVEAVDVTEKYRALDQRVRTLEATLARLDALLAGTRDETQRMKLLAEIARVTEQLELVRGSFRVVADLASLSRIGVEVANAPPPPMASFRRPDPVGMAWLAQLSPLNRAVGLDPRRVDVPVPEGFVAVSEDGPLYAESADGSALWTMQVPNEPRGDTDFWAAAVADRVATEGTTVSRRTLGDWACVDASREPDRSGSALQWQICVRTVGREVQVVQVSFASPAQHERYARPVDVALGGGAS